MNPGREEAPHAAGHRSSATHHHRIAMAEFPPNAGRSMSGSLERGLAGQRRHQGREPAIREYLPLKAALYSHTDFSSTFRIVSVNRPGLSMLWLRVGRRGRRLARLPTPTPPLTAALASRMAVNGTYISLNTMSRAWGLVRHS